MHHAATFVKGYLAVGAVLCALPVAVAWFYPIRLPATTEATHDWLLAFLALNSILAAAGAWLLTKGKRAVAIVALSLQLFLFPFGTLLAPAALVVLLGKQNKAAGTTGEPASPFVSQAIRIVPWIVVIALWSYCQGLPGRWPLPELSPALWLLSFIGAGALALLGHEAGHLALGWAGDMYLRRFSALGLKARSKAHGWLVSWSIRDLVAGGECDMAPSSVGNPGSSVALCYLGGPAASLLLAMCSWLALVTAPGSAWAPGWFFLACLAVDSAALFVFSSVSISTSVGYSDGARFLQCLRGGMWTDRLVAHALEARSQRSALRPRNWDSLAVDRAATAPFTPADAVPCLLLAYRMHADRGRNDLAQAYLLRAREICSLPDQPWTREAAVEIALHELEADNGPEARLWFDQAERDDSLEWHLAHAGVLFHDGERKAAESALARACALAGKLPRAGYHEPARERLERLAERWRSRKFEDAGPLLETAG